MAVDIKLGTDIVWGTTGAGTLTTGKILSCDRKSGSKVVEQEDEDGETYSVIFFDQTEEVTVEVLAKTLGAAPAIGSLVTIGGVTDCLVMDSTTKWAAGQTKKFSITFKKWVA